MWFTKASVGYFLLITPSEQSALRYLNHCFIPSHISMLWSRSFVLEVFLFLLFFLLYHPPPPSFFFFLTNYLLLFIIITLLLSLWCKINYYYICCCVVVCRINNSLARKSHRQHRCIKIFALNREQWIQSGNLKVCQR